MNQWRKSSYSNGGGGGCVEVGRDPDAIGVRDTKQANDPNRPELAFGESQWVGFLNGVKTGKYDQAR